MKVAIFENEFINVEASFKAFNLIYFKNALNYEIFTTSQSMKNLEDLANYDVLIVDIDLAKSSKMDGFQLLETIGGMNINKPKIMILTGHHSMKEQLTARDLPLYPIISKPVSLNKIKAVFDHYGLKP